MHEHLIRRYGEAFDIEHSEKCHFQLASLTFYAVLLLHFDSIGTSFVVVVISQNFMLSEAVANA